MLKYPLNSEGQRGGIRESFTHQRCGWLQFGTPHGLLPFSSDTLTDPELGRWISLRTPELQQILT